MSSARPVIIANEKEVFLEGKSILVIEFFDVCDIYFIGPFVSSHGMKYILVGVDYV